MKKKTVVISVNQLAVFDFLRRNKYELGGYLDFSAKNKIERFLAYFGQRNGVDFEDLDYEIDFHTHPEYDDGRIFNPPSPSDLTSLLEASVPLSPTDTTRRTQASLIFAEEGVYVVTLTKDLLQEYIEKTDVERDDFLNLIDDTVDNAFEASHHPNDTSYKNPYYTLVKDYGFDVKLKPYNRQLKIPIYIHES